MSGSPNRESPERELSSSVFEGTEKKVELVVSPDHPPLREFGETRWRRVVERSGARVLSKISSDACDAYLLSESSLFVFDDHVTMITCGQTTLIDGIVEMLEFIDRDRIQVLVFERKNEHFPERQPTTFLDDAARLNRLIPGRAYRFGSAYDHRVQMFLSNQAYSPEPDDTTLEVLMHDIDEEASARFEASTQGGASLAERTGLARIFPGFTLDEHRFDPSGYSLNALDRDRYYTVHITPQSVASYVSFETNDDFRGRARPLIAEVIQLFRPRSVDVVSFLPEGTIEATLPGYFRRNHLHQRFDCGYDVTFLQFVQTENETPITRPLEIPL